MTRDELYLNRLAHFLGQGLDLPAARDMASLAVMRDLLNHRFDFRPLTNADVQADADAYREEQGL